MHTGWINDPIHWPNCWCTDAIEFVFGVKLMCQMIYMWLFLYSSMILFCMILLLVMIWIGRAFQQNVITYICKPNIAINFCMKLVEVITVDVNPNHQNSDCPIPNYHAGRCWGLSTFIEYPLYFQNHQKSYISSLKVIGVDTSVFLFALVV